MELLQERTYKLRNQAMDALVALIEDIKKARAQGKTAAELATAWKLQRHAQFFVDFVEAENSMGFHAPEEAARILAESVDLSRQGQIALRDPNFQPRFPEVTPAKADRPLPRVPTPLTQEGASAPPEAAK